MFDEIKTVRVSPTLAVCCNELRGPEGCLRDIRFMSLDLFLFYFTEPISKLLSGQRRLRLSMPKEAKQDVRGRKEGNRRKY